VYDLNAARLNPTFQCSGEKKGMPPTFLSHRESVRRELEPHYIFAYSSEYLARHQCVLPGNQALMQEVLELEDH
jgi:hypothetical protein